MNQRRPKNWQQLDEMQKSTLRRRRRTRIILLVLVLFGGLFAYRLAASNTVAVLVVLVVQIIAVEAVLRGFKGG